MWRLLSKHISKVQLAGFALANLVGLAIVILAVQFYLDVRPVFNDEESFISKDYLVITRSVTTAGAMLGDSNSFSDADIAALEQQPWCRSVGRFENSDFGISATLGLGSGGRSMRSQFFFESIPDEFIDVDGAAWDFDPARPVVPVIVSRDYLSLYNLGFATTRGMPQISEGQAGMIPIQFTFDGAGRHETMQGRIVGFSTRLNTVIVPLTFMRWANERYGSGQPSAPVRLIVEVSKPGDMAIEQYMDEHHYDVAGDKMAASKANYFLVVIIGIVITVGIIISALAFFVLMLSIYLLLQKNARKLHDLLLLGFSPAEVSRPYEVLVVAVNVVVLVLAIVLMLVARSFYMDMVHAFGVSGSSVLAAVAAGFVLMAIITVGNIIAIRRRVAALW